MQKDRKGEGPPEPVWFAMARHAHLGLQLALSTGLFLAVGWWVDGKLHTTPLLTVVGALVGAAAGFYSMIRQLLPGSRDQGAGTRHRSEEEDV